MGMMTSRVIGRSQHYGAVWFVDLKPRNKFVDLKPRNKLTNFECVFDKRSFQFMHYCSKVWDQVDVYLLSCSQTNAYTMLNIDEN